MPSGSVHVWANACFSLSWIGRAFLSDNPISCYTPFPFSVASFPPLYLPLPPPSRYPPSTCAIRAPPSRPYPPTPFFPLSLIPGRQFHLPRRIEGPLATSAFQAGVFPALVSPFVEQSSTEKERPEVRGNVQPKTYHTVFRIPKWCIIYSTGFVGMILGNSMKRSLFFAAGERYGFQSCRKYVPQLCPFHADSICWNHFEHYRAQPLSFDLQFSAE